VTDPNHPYNSCHPVLRRGALAIVTNVGTGCGGRGSVGARSVSRAGFRERARRADERRLNAFARSLAGGTGWLNGLAEEAAYGKTVWFWRPLLASSRRRFAKLNRAMRAVNSPAMEARRIRLQGELGISRKTIAQGMPECSDCTCMLVCVFYTHYCTRDRGCSVHPAFPAPSIFEGQGSRNASGALSREIAESCSGRRARLVGVR
jgi:hypothetical protein